MLYYLTVAIYVIVCLTLIMVVLLQQGKGGGMANAFGGGGSSQAAFGARSGATVLSRATTICAVLFIVGALALGIMGQRGPGSVVGGRAARDAADPDLVTRGAAAAGNPGSCPRPGEVTDPSLSARKWRNWQTHQLEGLAVAIPWGFESPSAPDFRSPVRPSELRSASHAKSVAP